MINQLVKFTVKPEHNKIFKAALVEDVRGADQEKGNMEMKMFVDNNNPNIFFAYERWENQEALHFHMKQLYTKKVMEIVEMALITKPEIINLDVTNPTPIHQAKELNSEDELLTIFFIIKIKKDLLDEVLKEFPRQVKLTRKEEGNILFNLYQAKELENTFVVYEQWRSKVALDNHFTLPYSGEMGKILTEAVDGPLPNFMNFVTLIA